MIQGTSIMQSKGRVAKQGPHIKCEWLWGRIGSGHYHISGDGVQSLAG